MAMSDSFLQDARIGMTVSLVVGPKEIAGKIISLDAEIVGLKKEDGFIARINHSTIIYYEFLREEEEIKVEPPVEAVIGVFIEEKSATEIAVKPHENEIIDLLEESIETTVETELTYSMIEEAIVHKNIDDLKQYFESGEKLYALGYSEILVERIQNKLFSNDTSMPKGDDLYSTANRLFWFQDNFNQSAESYYLKTLDDDASSSAQKQKAMRKLQSFYIMNRDFAEYEKLVNNYEEHIDLISAKNCCFHIDYLKSLNCSSEQIMSSMPLEFGIEGEYIYLFNYLYENPDDYIAKKVMAQLSNSSIMNFGVAKAVLKYVEKYDTQQAFEDLRKKYFVLLYSKNTTSQMLEMLDIGYPIKTCVCIEKTKNRLDDESETESEVESETENTELEVQRRSVDEIVIDYLEDTELGVVRAVFYTQQTEEDSYLLQEHLREIRARFDEESNRVCQSDDKQEKLFAIIFFEVCGMSKEKLTVIRQSMRNDSDSKLFKALERYDEKKVKKIVSDTEGLLKEGYTESEIQRFEKLIRDKPYSIAKANYDVATRLIVWGFQNQALKYYIAVANDVFSPKRETAIRQIILYAVQLKKYSIFEKYYVMLDSEQKQMEVYLKFLNECKYRNKEYEELYRNYIADKNTLQPVLIYGALKTRNHQELQAELIEKACFLGRFNYEFWNEYLTDVSQDSLEEYRSILAKILNEYTVKATEKIQEAYKLICLDPRFQSDITEEMIQIALEDAQSVVIAMVLCIVSTNISEEYMNQVYDYGVGTLREYIEQMEYKKAYELGCFVRANFVANEEVKKIMRIATKGIDMYNMLPSEQDNYAKGKRFLILGDDPERAFSYFVQEIETSHNTKKIALCGRELLAGLLEAERYQEVISWGHKLIIEKEILEYSALVLDINNAFEKLMDNIKKEEFLEALVHSANQSIEKNEYDKAFQKINAIEIFDRNHVLVSQYKDVLQKTKIENINLNNQSMIGKANIIRYIENDEIGYISYVKEAFKAGLVEKESKSSLAASLLEVLIKSGRVVENMDFIDEINSYEFSLTEHILELLYTIVIEQKELKDAITYFHEILRSRHTQKRSSILIRLERFYKIALQNGVSFDAIEALKYMQEYMQENNSLQVRLIYNWILAYLGDLESAGELLAFISDDMELESEQQEIVHKIVNDYFGGQKPELLTMFNELIKEKTFYQLIEYCKGKKEFILFSDQENRIFTQIIKHASNKVDTKDPIVKTTLCKMIYKEPMNFKYWYLYYRGVRTKDDYELEYSLHMILETLCLDDGNVRSKLRVNALLEINPKVRAHYGEYVIYNKLFKFHLQKTDQGNKMIIELLTETLEDNKSCIRNLSSEKVAKEYIQLLKLLDDGDDHIFMKVALVIATENDAHEYFYELYKRELLYQESVLGIRMCVALLCMKKNGEKYRSFCNMVLNELKEVSGEHERIIEVLSNPENCFEEAGTLLLGYPDIPKEMFILEVMNRKTTKYEFKLQLLEILDYCYVEFLSVKRMLVFGYTRMNSKLYYEKIYQCLLPLLKNEDVEEKLYENSCFAMLIATAIDKKNFISDIMSIYKTVSINQENRKRLDTFSKACCSIEWVSEGQWASLLQAIIHEDWYHFHRLYGNSFIVDNEHMKSLVSYAKIPYMQGAFSYIRSIKNRRGPSQKGVVEQFQVNLNKVSLYVFGESILKCVGDFCKLPVGKRDLFVKLFDLKKNLNSFDQLLSDEKQLNNEELMANLFEIWHILYGKKVMIDIWANVDHTKPEYEYFCKHAISFYKSKEILDNYIESLYESKEYHRIVELYTEFSEFEKGMKTITYYIGSLLKENEAQALDLITELQGEQYINVILLLQKEQEYSEKDIIYKADPVKSRVTELILSINPASDSATRKMIENQYSGEMKMGLLKLFYCTIYNEEIKRDLYKNYTSLISENEYISRSEDMWSLEEINDQFQNENIENINAVALEPVAHYDYVTEIQEKISMQEYESGIPRGERRKLLDIYEQLGTQLSASPEYRKEILAKLIYIVSEAKEKKEHEDYKIKLGGVLYYCNVETNPQKGRKILFEAIRTLSETSMKRTIKVIRVVMCDALRSYDDITEMIEEKRSLSEALQSLAIISGVEEFTDFCASIVSSLENIAHIAACSDISQKIQQYKQVLEFYREQRTKSGNSESLNKVYIRWSRIIQIQLKRLSKGAVLNLEVETKQCSRDGKICCILQNSGMKPAKNIVVKAIFDVGIRCKVNEKEKEILYGNDTMVFAFPIRSRIDGVGKFKIELSYENSKDVEQLEYDYQVRIVDNLEYNHIVDPYTLDPVKSNEEFYGRELEKKTLEHFLRDTRNNTSIVMHGLKRVGKTSMLRYLERIMKNSEQYIPVYKSAQSVGGETPASKLFVKSVMDELENIGVVDDKCRSYVELDYDKNPELLHEFYKYLEESNILQGKKILFMADEIEEIFDMIDTGVINKKFYKVLRVILQELTVIRFIFCGADYLTNILYNFSLVDIFETTKRITISRLDEESMNKMITEPTGDQVTYTRHALERIWYYTKGHTFYSKQICSTIIGNLNEESRMTVYAYDVDCALVKEMDVAEHFMYLSRFFTQNDKEVIRILCQNIKFAGDRVSLEKLEGEYESGGLASVLRGLEFKDIIVKIEERDDEYYQFAIEMFRLWYSTAEYTVVSAEEMRNE